MVRIGWRGGLVVGLAAGLVVGGTVAWATIPSANGTITGCFSVKTGALRVIDPAKGACASGEARLTWNQKGPSRAQSVSTEAKGDVTFTTSGGAVPRDLGPSLMVTVPPSGLIQFFVRADISGSECDIDGSAVVSLMVDNLEVASITASPYRACKGTYDRGGPSSAGVQELSPGPHTVHVLYYGVTSSGSSLTFHFKNRKVWAVPVP